MQCKFCSLQAHMHYTHLQNTYHVPWLYSLARHVPVWLHRNKAGRGLRFGSTALQSILEQLERTSKVGGLGNVINSQNRNLALLGDEEQRLVKPSHALHARDEAASAGFSRKTI